VAGFARTAQCAGCAQPVTIWPRYLSPTKFFKFCGARCLPNLLGFEPVVLIAPPIAKNKNDHKGRCYFWWEYACTNRAENKQEFNEFMQRVKAFNKKYIIVC